MTSSFEYWKTSNNQFLGLGNVGTVDCLCIQLERVVSMASTAVDKWFLRIPDITWQLDTPKIKIVFFQFHGKMVRGWVGRAPSSNFHFSGFLDGFVKAVIDILFGQSLSLSLDPFSAFSLLFFLGGDLTSSASDSLLASFRPLEVVRVPGSLLHVQ